MPSYPTMSEVVDTIYVDVKWKVWIFHLVRRRKDSSLQPHLGEKFLGSSSKISLISSDYFSMLSTVSS